LIEARWFWSSGVVSIFGAGVVVLYLFLVLGGILEIVAFRQRLGCCSWLLSYFC